MKINISELKEQIKKEGRVILKNFGTFELKKVEAKTVRNNLLGHGELVIVPEHLTVKFKCSKHFFDEDNNDDD